MRHVGVIMYFIILHGSLGKILHSSSFSALKANGDLISWGGDHITDGVTSFSNVSPLMYATDSALSAIALNHNGVFTWGDTVTGGDSSAVSSELNSTEVVTSIISAQWAFAALLSNGSVIVWGDSGYGGSLAANFNHNLPTASSTPTDVVSLFSNGYAFCALTSAGYIYSWGYAPYGADVTDSLPVLWTDSSFAKVSDRAVKGVASSSDSFAALTENGKVLTWGGPTDSTMESVLSQLYTSGNEVKAIYSTYYAFAAIVEGTNDTRSCSSNDVEVRSYVVAWGAAANGGDYSSQCSNLFGTENTTLSKIYSNPFSFALLKSDGSVVTWGNSLYGGDSSSVSSDLVGVVDIYHTAFSFAALKDTGEVVVWGSAASGGSLPSSVSIKISEGTVLTITATFSSYAVLFEDGSVVCWGGAANGAGTCDTPSSLQTQLSSSVVSISANTQSFAALKSNGSVVCWGTSGSGGDCDFSSPTYALSGDVVQVSTIDDLNSFYDSRITQFPTSQPSRVPSAEPTNVPTTRPSGEPSSPTSKPTGSPSSHPSAQPSSYPTISSTGQPSGTQNKKKVC